MRSRERRLETEIGSNDEKETNVVTQNGCCRGKHFGGYEERVRERHRGPTIAEMRMKGDCTGNASNPMAGCRVKQTCGAACGANRRSREERQGRKVRLVWQRDAEGRPFIEWEAGTGRMMLMSAEGHSLENHKRGSLTISVKAGRPSGRAAENEDRKTA